MLQIVRINTKFNLMYVDGFPPGAFHGYVRIYDARSRKRQETREEERGEVAMPTFFKDDLPGEQPENLYDKDLFDFSEPTIVFTEEAK